MEQLAIVSGATNDSSSTRMATDRDRGSELCTSCGLCCRGALHQAAVLDEDEIDAARKLGLPVLDRAKPGFALPCPRLAGTVCSIYGNRPRVCGRYQCRLLQELQAGDVSFEEACAKVRTAQALVETLERAMPAGMTLQQARGSVIEPARVEQPGMAQLDRGAALRLRLAATAATLYIDRHFRNEREGQLLTLTNVQADGEKE